MLPDTPYTRRVPSAGALHRIGTLAASGWRAKLYASAAAAAGLRREDVAAAARAYRAGVADPALSPVAGFALLSRGRLAGELGLSVFWWEAGALLRTDLDLPGSGVPSRAPGGHGGRAGRGGCPAPDGTGGAGLEAMRPGCGDALAGRLPGGVLRVTAGTGRATTFFGWRVTWAAFAVAVFGWGVGFYGPPVFLHAIREERGWPVSLVSGAITCHFLFGAVVVANLAALHRRYGVAGVTRAGAVASALGILGWALAREPWQLYAATLPSGFGWAATGAAAINAMVAPWFARRRPAALSTAYNGASVGGVFCPRSGWRSSPRWGSRAPRPPSGP